MGIQPTRAYVTGVIVMGASKIVDTVGDRWDTTVSVVETGVISAAVLHLTYCAIEYGKRVKRAVEKSEAHPRLTPARSDNTHRDA